MKYLAKTAQGLGKIFWWDGYVIAANGNSDI